MATNLMLRWGHAQMGESEWFTSTIDGYLHQLSRRENVAKGRTGLSGHVASFLWMSVVRATTEAFRCMHKAVGRGLRNDSSKIIKFSTVALFLKISTHPENLCFMTSLRCMSIILVD